MEKSCKTCNFEDRGDEDFPCNECNVADFEELVDDLYNCWKPKSPLYKQLEEIKIRKEFDNHIKNYKRRKT